MFCLVCVDMMIMMGAYEFQEDFFSIKTNVEIQSIDRIFSFSVDFFFNVFIQMCHIKSNSGDK